MSSIENDLDQAIIKLRNYAELLEQKNETAQAGSKAVTVSSESPGSEKSDE